MNSTKDIKTKLEQNLSVHRKKHSLSTAEYALFLLKRYKPLYVKEDEMDVINSALVHDIAREYSKEDLIEYALAHNIEFQKEEMEFPILLHAPVAADLISQYPFLHKERVKRAVRWHSIGSPAMGFIGAILFCADYMESTRAYMNDTRREDLLQSTSIEALTLRVVLQQIEHMRENGTHILSSTLFLSSFLSEGGLFGE